MKTYRHIALAALALSFAACSQVDDFTPQGDLKDTPITIASAGVAELTTRAGSVLVGTEENPATMSVFVSGGTTDRYDATNVKWTNEGSYWNGVSAMLFEGVGSQQQIYALSPYVEGATDGPVTITADGRTDYLVATQTSLTSSVVSLTMTHALAKLVLIPTFGTEVTDQTITSVKVGGMYASGTLDIAGNTWDAGEETTELTMTDKELLVIPMEACSGFPITITMADGRMFKTTVSLNGVENKLAAGTQYNIKLQIGQDKVTIEQVSTSDFGSPFGDGWNNEEDLN